MKNLITLLILFSCTSLLLGQNLDSTHFETKSEGDWVLKNRTHYTYDQSNLLDWVVLRWSSISESWNKISEGSNSYNANGMLDKVCEQAGYGWNLSSLVQKEYSYNSIDKVDTLTVFEGIPPAWLLFPDYRIRYVYDTNGRLKHSFGDWRKSGWSKGSKTSYTYNVQGLPSKLVREFWNSESNQWEINAKELNTYNGSGDIVENVRLKLEEGSWVNKEKTSSSYNSSGYLSTEVLYVWGELINDWSIKYKWDYTYHSNFSEMLVIFSFQNQTTGEIIESSRITYFYSTSLDLMEEQFKPIIIYPNPANNLVNIHLKNSSSAKITLADISGRLMQSINIEEGQQEYQMDISAYPSGIYFIEVFQDGQKVQSEKLIIQ